MAEGLCFLACGNIKKEIDTILAEKQFEGVKAMFFTPFCYFQKSRKTDQKPDLSRLGLESCGRTEVLCGPYCFNNSDFNGQQYKNISLNNEQNCLNFLINPCLASSLIENKSYLISPGFLNQWQYIFEEIWGFRQEYARKFFKESSDRIVLLDTGVYPESRQIVKEVSAYLDITYKIMDIGMDYLRMKLVNIKQNWKMKEISNDYQGRMAETGKRIANYELSFEVIKGLANILDEQEIIEKFLNLTNLLFGPSSIAYGSINSNGTLNVYQKHFRGSVQESSNLEQKLLELSSELKGQNYRIIDGHSFLIKLEAGHKDVGYLLVENIVDKDYIRRYINESITICSIAALALINGRRFEELERLKEKYRFHSLHDSLTSVYNRFYYEEEIKRLNSNLSRYLPLTVIVADIDKLKHINDVYGHAVGDKAIKTAAEKLSSLVRKNDVLARVGGDEFCAIMPETSESAAQERIKVLKQSMESCLVKDTELNMDVTLGSYTSTDPNLDMEEIIKRADKLMYKHKKIKKSKQSR